MKILPKDEIEKAKNTDRAREIQEGLKLSRKVDELRKLKVEEEENFNKFKEETLKGINEEITSLSSERDGLLIEVGDLREEKQRGLEDLKQKERELCLFRDNLDERAKRIDEQKEEIKILQEEAIITSKEIEDDKLRIRTQLENAKKSYSVASEDRAMADKELKSAEKIKNDVLTLKEETEKELFDRKEKVKEREKKCSEREKENERISEEQAKEWKRIQDQRKTLERAINRLKQDERTTNKR